jgi:hypothetical protein
LRQRFLRRRQGEFAQLTKASLGLCNSALALHHRRAQLAVIEHHERIAALYHLTFVHGDLRDDASYLASDIDPEWRFNIAAYDNGVNEIGANYGVNRKNWPQNDGRSNPSKDDEGDGDSRYSPSPRPKDGDESTKPRE